MQDDLHPTPHPEQPPTKRGHERMVALLESATMLFLQHGFDAVSLDDIVQHAGGSKTSIYKYFGNKDGLFKAICDYRRTQFLQDICLLSSLQHSSDFRSYLVTTLIHFYEHIKQPENSAFMRLILEQSGRNPDIARHIHEQGPKHIQHCIAEVLAQANECGFLVCKDPLFSAQFYFGILRNLEWQILMGINTPEGDQEISKYIHYCVDIFLDGHQKV